MGFVAHCCTESKTERKGYGEPDEEPIGGDGFITLTNKDQISDRLNDITLDPME